MVKGTVAATGCMCELGDGGWYTVTAWSRLMGALSPETTVFEKLSWAEALDVIIAFTAANRPGWAVGDGWMQPPLFP